MKLKFYYVLLFAGLVLGSCTGQPETDKAPAALSREQESQISQEIMQKMATVIEGIRTGDQEKIFGDFQRSDSVSFMLNGLQLEGFDQIMEAFSQGAETRTTVQFEVVSEQVVVLDQHAAMHLAGFNNQLQLANDSIVTESGYWTAVFKKIDGAWKVVHVHESYNAVE